jgi:penicillin-binding protein 2
VSIIEGHQLGLPGVEIHVEPRRHYLYGTLAAHLLGYVSEVSSNQLGEETFKGLLPGTVVGQYGVEKTFDSLIRGKRGKKVIEVNALGHEQQVVRVSAPHSGQDIYLTVDLELQQKAEKILGGRSGAIVAMDPRNGEILSMVSHPPFDPNLLSAGIRPEVWEIISTDPQRPLNNRVIQGQYPPGSVFKIVVSSAMLESKQFDSGFQVDCKGYMPFGGRVFRDWKRGGHGPMNLHQAIVQSCDVFFYNVGYQLGVDMIAKYSRLFGLGEPTGIELESEKKGLIPTIEWKKRVRGEPWYPGETLSVAIGQGYVSVTPLQLVNMISVVANGGTLFQPKIFKGVLEKQTRQVEEPLPMPSRRVDLNPRTFAVLREALKGVVSDPEGTARSSRSSIVEIAGKTGTAQVIGTRPRAPTEPIPKEFLDHAWFGAFAPASDPKIAVVVLVENSGHGGSVAAPIAKEIIETYLAYDRSTVNHQL